MVALLLYGSPGVGKTTLVSKVIERLGSRRCAGFITCEQREGDRRKGFELVTLGGRRGLLARVGLDSTHQVGRYGVDLEALERVGIRAIEEGLQKGRIIIIIDEIGRMELFSKPFRRVVYKALEAPNPLLGTIMERSDGYADGIKARPDVTLLEVTLDNRDDLVDRILELLVSN